ncbi:Cytochrome P450 7B1 [Ceratobasidium sp. 428]|nr:Cytochrome P450 7B1 [Ceratobasidium sp. 395]KAG8782926.1 Cytochrome P450 7B1 [Ceratobasidium sp. 428]
MAKLSLSYVDTSPLIRGAQDSFSFAIARIERWLSALGVPHSSFGSAGGLSMLLASGALLYLWRVKRSRTDGQPPIVSYWVPWLGSALQVQRNPDSLFKKASRELGPVFGVKVFGSTLYHVTDADMIMKLYKQPNVFSGSPMQATFFNQIFDVSMHAITGSDIIGTMLQSKNRHLSPMNVQSLLSSFIAHARSQISTLPSNVSIPLLSLIVPPMQKSDCAMLFGSSFLPYYYDTVAPAFTTFDNNVPLLAINFPPFLMPGTIAARQTLLNNLDTYFAAGLPEDASGLLKEFVEQGHSQDWTTHDLAAFGLGLMWPLLANAPYAVYWLLAFHLYRPEGLKPLLDEVHSVLESGYRDLAEVVRDSGATPYLDACINEAIRLASDSYSMRWVAEGEDEGHRLGGYVFKAGDQVACNTRGAHMDEEVYARPEVFEPSRFIGEEKEKSRGRFIPFGGGFSICEGRHLALTQIKAFIIILLSEFDISLENESKAIPPFSPNNRGFGMIRPVGDLAVRLTRK